MSGNGNITIHIKGGRLIDPANKLDKKQDLYIADGHIAALGKAPDGFTAQKVINATGQIVCPGLVDLSARMREPGQEHKATIGSECRAAAASGITTLCIPPDTDPVIDTPAVVELIHQQAEHAGMARVVTLGALTRNLEGERLSEMASLKQAGCVGVSNALRPVANTLVEQRALAYAATFDLTVFLHSSDPWLHDGGCAHDGAVATRLGLPGIPEAAETAAVARDLALVEHTGVRAHFCRLTTERAVRMVARAQYDGLPVTVDVGMPYLYLTEMDINGFNSLCHVEPPLRTQQDRAGLHTALAKGIVTAICSDHQPHEPDSKLSPFPATEPGISGLETLLPLALRLTEESDMSVIDVIDRLTAGPAGILGLPCGTLSPGKAADVCIFDPTIPWRLQTSEMHSHGHNTPFMGWELKGKVTHTIFAGNLVYCNGQFK